MIMKIIKQLVQLGTGPQNDPKNNQIIRLINKICYFVILVIVPHMLLTLYFGVLPVLLLQAGTIIALCLTVFINSKHYYKHARVLTLIIGNFYIFIMALILGLNCGVHYYFSAAIIASLFFYTSDELKQVLLFLTLTIFLALLIQFIGTNYEPVIEIPDVLIISFFYFSVFASLCTVFIFVFHFYYESNCYEKSLRLSNEKLLKLSETDPLTRLANRRSFTKNFDTEWCKGIRNRTSLAVIMIDVDYFKMFNDCYGHQEGDRCLESVAGIISKNTRQYLDYPARYGGEEFIILLSNMNSDGAYISAERIRRELLNAAIPHELNGNVGLLSCSIGIACCLPDNDSSAENLIREADTALYKAKENGRNRVERYQASAVKAYDIFSSRKAC